MKTTRKTIAILAMIGLLAAMTGCSTTQKGAGIGAVLGAGAGALIGHGGNAGSGEGALIGAAIGVVGGALTGYIIEEKQKERDALIPPPYQTDAPAYQPGYQPGY